MAREVDVRPIVNKLGKQLLEYNLYTYYCQRHQIYSLRFSVIS